MITIPKGFSAWPEDAVGLTNLEVAKLYESGFAGCGIDEQAKAEIRQIVKDRGFSFSGADNAHTFGLADSHAGELVFPGEHVMKAFANCWPGAAQDRGDCVSHDTKNAALVSLVCDTVSSIADEITKLLEGLPEVDPKGISEGVLSTEYFYWFRGYNGDGWSCDAAANVALTKGMLLRNNYPNLGIDLREYSGGLAGKYGAQSPPEEITKAGQEHLIRTCAELKSFEEIRDYLGNGYGVSSCGGEGFSSTRDENGVSVRKGGWSHALALIGADDREIIKKLYGEPLVLILNSWGKWNSGGRRIYQTNKDIPEGSFWAKWSSVKNRYYVAFTSVAGWPRRKLPNLGATGLI